MGAARFLVLLFALLNYKSLPLSFHLRFWAIVGRYFYLSDAKPKSIYDEGVYRTFTPFLEMDFNMHKSNSTYFSDMDMSRSVLMAKVFKKTFREYSEPEIKLAPHQFVYSALGSVSCVFRHEIMPYQRYDVVSQVFAWNDKWLYVVTKFVRNGKIYAFGLAKYVFKLKRKTVPPQVAIEFCGLLTDEAVAENAKRRKYVDDALELEQIEHLI